MLFLRIEPNLLLLIICLCYYVECNQRFMSSHEKFQDDDHHEGQIPPPAHDNRTPDKSDIQQALRDVFTDGLDADLDGRVTDVELNSWLGKIHRKVLAADIEKQWKYYDPMEQDVHSWEGYLPEKKQVLSWDSYFNLTYPELVGIHLSDIDKDDKPLQELKMLATRSEGRWRNADENGDTLLTKDEFKLMIHPEEGNDRTKELFLTEAIEDMDLDKNKKVSLNEFIGHIKTIATEDAKTSEWIEGQKNNFNNYLDKNKDSVLDQVELKNWLVPEPDERHLMEVQRLFAVGDTNEDKLLSKDEILEKYDQFAAILPPEYWTRYDDHTTVSYSSHDEL